MGTGEDTLNEYFEAGFPKLRFAREVFHAKAQRRKGRPPESRKGLPLRSLVRNLFTIVCNRRT